MDGRDAPVIDGILRRHMIRVPEAIASVRGIRIFGKLIRSLVFTTDVAVIKNINADAVMAVYPFTPQPIISQAVIETADVPVFCGVGGGITTGERTLRIARHAEFQGALAVVVNAPTADEVIRQVSEHIDIPLAVTVVGPDTDFVGRVAAGARILNVSGAARTPEIVARIRDVLPDVPIIATGGKTEESIMRTIEAGADAITYTPPTPAELLAQIMQGYRNGGDDEA